MAFPINIEVTKALLAFAPSTFQKALFNVPATALDRSFDMFEELVNGPPSPLGLLTGYCWPPITTGDGGSIKP